MGKLVIDGVDVGSLGERGRTLFRLNRLGYVFQDYALVPELTAEENIYLPSKVRGMTVKECTRACRDILSLVGLKDRLNFLPGELSGGEQQRVAIARALVNKPSLILADEPCANLDTRNSRIILDLIKKLNKELGQTIVMVSHEDWHKAYFDRIITMTDGKIQADSDPGTKNLPEAA
jgi:putative ABC transport system ATP-binding protein